jgi:hypothetical protein
MRTKLTTTTLALALLGACCGSTGAAAGGGHFTTTIDNRYLPLAPGSRWIYREKLAGGRTQRVSVTVTKRTKKVAAGMTARVVHDFATERGALVEDTYDWYAQDSAGNVWYLGEETAEYQRGKVVSREGSWEAGVDGAQAGIVMLAHPRGGLTYRQEYYAGHAEDHARVLSLAGHATVPFGRFAHVLVTRDFSPLEPKATEHKYYEAGIGQVLSVSRTGEREELVSFRRGG